MDSARQAGATPESRVLLRLGIQSSTSLKNRLPVLSWVLESHGLYPRPSFPPPGLRAPPAFVFRPARGRRGPADKGAQRHLVAAAGRGAHSFQAGVGPGGRGLLETLRPAAKARERTRSRSRVPRARSRPKSEPSLGGGGPARQARVELGPRGGRTLGRGAPAPPPWCRRGDDAK